VAQLKEPFPQRMVLSTHTFPGDNGS